MLDNEKTQSQLLSEVTVLRQQVAQLQAEESRYKQIEVEHQRVLQHAHMAEAKFRSLLEAAPDAIVIVNKNGRIALVNTQTEQLFGYSREELLDHPLEMLLPDHLQHRHMRHRAAYAAHPRTRPMGTGLAIVGRRKDNSEFPADIKLSPLQTEDEELLIISTIRDITAHKKTEALLREQQELLHVTLASIGDAVVATDEGGAITFMNPEAARLIGLPTHVALGKNVEEVLSFVDEYTHQEASNPVVEVLRKDQIVRLSEHINLRTLGGMMIPVDDIAAPIHSADGARHGAVVVLRDVTRRRQIERALLRAKEEAEAANQAKSEFLATMSHELRTPLNIIMGYTDLLIEEEFGPLTVEECNILQRVRRNTHELYELISATLDLNRMEAGRFLINSQEVRVSELLEQIQIETQALQEQSPLSFTWYVDPLTPVLYTDPFKVKLILKNLIGNAVKFTERGRVTITAQCNNEGVELSVSDTGIGIPQESLSMIFKPFWRLEHASTHRYEGTGLGLHIVKRTLELLGGTITVESEVGKGSTFRVTLPLAQPRVPSLDQRV